MVINQTFSAILPLASCSFAIYLVPVRKTQWCASSAASWGVLQPGARVLWVALCEPSPSSSQGLLRNRSLSWVPKELTRLQIVSGLNFTRDESLGGSDSLLSAFGLTRALSIFKTNERDGIKWIGLPVQKYFLFCRKLAFRKIFRILYSASGNLFLRLASVFCFGFLVNRSSLFWCCFSVKYLSPA